jgi:P27 family predicted phage terminase small subunit
VAKRGPKVRQKGRATGEIEIPEGLDEPGRVEFLRLVEQVRARGTLDRIDVQLLVATARTVVLLEKAHAELGAGALTKKSGDGTPMPHPMLNVINVQTMRLRGLLNDLGLTPKTSKLGDAPAKKAENPWEGLLNVAG